VENLNLKKFFLYLLICSIALSALMGIWAIISGEFGELQGKILGTTTTVVGTSILGLACGAYLESPRSRHSPRFVMPVFGIVFTVVSASLVLWMIWVMRNWNGEWLFKTLSTCLIFAFSLAQLSLLSLARLAKRFNWALITAYIAVLALALITSTIIILEPPSSDGFVLRMIGVLGVLDASMTVMIPIFHRLSRTEFVDVETASTDKIDAEIASLKTQISRLEKQKEDILNAEKPA
jgi:magnesium-transporting ATPase (P-type)